MNDTWYWTGALWFLFVMVMVAFVALVFIMEQLLEIGTLKVDELNTDHYIVKVMLSDDEENDFATARAVCACGTTVISLGDESADEAEREVLIEFEQHKIKEATRGK